MRLRRSALALGLVLIGAPAIFAGLYKIRADAAADLLLLDAATAHERVSYHGEAAWRRGRWHRSVDVRHDAHTGWSCYRWNGRPHCMSGPSTRSSDPAAWCLDRAAAVGSYRAREVGQGMFLGRKTRLLTLEPRHAGRPRLELNVDLETGLPLQVTTYAHDGSLYRVMAFREIEFGVQDLPESKGRTHSSWRGWWGRDVATESLGHEVGFSVLLPAYLPEGFQVRRSRVSDWWGGSVTVSYTDGVTVFEVKQKRVLTPAQLEHMLTAKMGERRARYVLRRIDRIRRKRLIQESETLGDGISVRREKRRRHHLYRLRVGDIDMTVTARSDFDPSEVLKVLRSLRPVH